MAAPFDPRLRAITGPAVAVLDDVSVIGYTEAAVAWSASGTLAYTRGPVKGSSRVNSRLVRVTKDGSTPVAVDSDYFRQLSVSPDGARLAATTWDGSLWVYDLGRNTRVKLPEGG